MQLIRHQRSKNPCLQHSVIAIGNFDGMHLGHQSLIETLQAMGERFAVPSAVMTFEPHPLEFFSKDNAKPRLMRWREKWNACEMLGVDFFLCMHFNKAFAELEPEQFVKDYLVDQFGVRGVVVGDDFRFGRKRLGDFDLLCSLGNQYQFEVQRMNPVMIDDERVSSTRIRQALAESNFTLAEKLLGKPYVMTGKVAHGDKLGRQLGYPTANIHVHRHKVPLQGIFAVRVHGIEDEPLTGVANLGTRPTINNSTRVLLEVYIFDFDDDIYGKNIQVEFLHKIRDEARFDSLDDLVVAMKQDEQAARDFFQK